MTTTTPTGRLYSPAVPLVLATALFMENVDATIIATSLATIARDLDTEPVALKLALTSYLVALSIFIPASNWVADRFGARRVFRLAMLVFVVGSLCCAVANSLETFVVSRFLQGVGGGMMTPIARLIIVRSTARHDLVRAMAWLSIPALIGPVLGPPLGGLITTYSSWHWIFLVNVPIGLVGFFVAGALLPEWPPHKLPPLDYLGLLLAGTGFAGCLFGLSVLTLPALPPVIGYVTLVTGIISMAVYVVRFRRVVHPLLDLTIFRFPLFRRTVVGGFLFRIGAGAMPFLFPLMLQLTYGLNPLQSGLITFATAFGALSAKFSASGIIGIVGFRTTILVATFLSGSGLFSIAFFTPDTPFWLMIGLLTAIGFCQSTFWTAANAFTFADVNERDVGQANIISQVSVQLSLATGVAVGGALLEWVRQTHGGDVQLQDFNIAFGAIACLGLIGTLAFWSLPKNAGDDMARRRLP